MTREEAKQLASVMQAYAEGKEVQIQVYGQGPWLDQKAPSFYEGHKWRVKPEPPKSREWWLSMTKAGRADRALPFRNGRQSHFKRQPRYYDYSRPRGNRRIMSALLTFSALSGRPGEVWTHRNAPPRALLPRRGAFEGLNGYGGHPHQGPAPGARTSQKPQRRLQGFAWGVLTPRKVPTGREASYKSKSTPLGVHWRVERLKTS